MRETPKARVGVMLAAGVCLMWAACDKGGKKEYESCQTPSLEIHRLPVTFELEKDDRKVGYITVSADQALSFVAAPGADEERVSDVRTVVEKLSASDSAMFSFSDWDPDSETHYTCGGEIKRGTPQYPEAVKAHLYSDEYFNVEKVDGVPAAAKAQAPSNEDTGSTAARTSADAGAK